MSASPHFQARAIRIFRHGHVGSVLSVCAVPELGYLISGGSDGRVVVWSISAAVPIKIFEGQDGHLDSVLCVRCNERIIVSCSKDRTIRTYNLSILEPIYVLVSHRAAVNSVAISDKYIVSASGDRSLRLWNSETGELLHVFESHHSRISLMQAMYSVLRPSISTSHTSSQDRQTSRYVCTSWVLNGVGQPIHLSTPNAPLAITVITITRHTTLMAHRAQLQAMETISRCLRLRDLIFITHFLALALALHIWRLRLRLFQEA